MTDIQKTATCLWFEHEAEEAANFYVSIFPESRVEHEVRSHADWPGGKAGDVVVVGFVLMGQPYQALNGGPSEPFNDRVSVVVPCEDQAEIDHYWKALTAHGGEPVMCGWLKDRYGVRWQVVPRVFYELVQDRDAEKSRRVMEAMMQMVKLDIAALEAAYHGG